MEKMSRFKIGLMLVLCIIASGPLYASGQQDGSKDSDGSKEVVYKSTLNVAYEAEPNTLDPHSTGATATREVGRNIYEGLFELDADYQPRPELCESYKANDDFTKYTFYLRKGVKFHNGQEMKAEDVCASLNRWLVKNGIPKKSIKHGEQFVKVDDYTVEISLEQPVVLLPYILANNSIFAAIMPASVIEEAGDGKVDKYIGTGPLMLDEWKQTQYVHFVKFDDYVPYAEESSGSWGKKDPKFKDMYMYFVTDPSIRLAGLETGEYDVAVGLSYDDYDRIISNDELITDYDASNTINLIMNKKSGMFTNKLYRQALSFAVDVDEIIAGTIPLKSCYNANACFFAKKQPAWYTDVSSFVYQDLGKVKSLLAEANYDGTPCRIITTTAIPILYNSSLILKQQLEEAGIKTDLIVGDWATMLNYLCDPSTYDCYTMGYPLASNPASVMYITSAINAGFTNDPGLNAMFDEMNSKSSLEEASEYWKSEVQKYCNEEALAFSFGDFSYITGLTAKTVDYDIFYGVVYYNLAIAE